MISGYVHTKPDKNVLRPHHCFRIVSLSTLKKRLGQRSSSCCDVSVFKKFRFRPFSPSTLTHLAGVFKFIHFRERPQKVPFSPSTLTHPADVFKDFHFGERFQKVPFSVTENAILLWTEGLFGEKKIRFQIYPDLCGRSL